MAAMINVYFSIAAFFQFEGRLSLMSHDHHVLEQPGFVQLWNPELMVFTLLLLVAYMQLVGPWRHKFLNSEPARKNQKLLFVTGLVIFYIAKGSPLQYYGHHYLFSAHMLQMALIYFVVPPLLLLGTPEWIFRKLFLQSAFAKRIFLFLTLPLVSIFLFNMLFSFYHLPFVFDAVMSNVIFHTVFHLILLFGAFIMWWPLTNVLPEYQRLPPLWRIAYIFGSGLLLTPVCVLVIFASQPMYEMYLHAPQLFELLPTLDDQQLGGVIMKVVQEIAFITTITIIFFTWARTEREQDSSAPPQITEAELK
jgi:putative membrane protein